MRRRPTRPAARFVPILALVLLLAPAGAAAPTARAGVAVGGGGWSVDTGSDDHFNPFDPALGEQILDDCLGQLLGSADETVARIEETRVDAIETMEFYASSDVDFDWVSRTWKSAKAEIAHLSRERREEATRLAADCRFAIHRFGIDDRSAVSSIWSARSEAIRRVAVAQRDATDDLGSRYRELKAAYKAGAGAREAARRAAKEAEKARKQAEKAARKAEKRAEKEARKAAKRAAKEARRAAREAARAEKRAEKEARRAEKLAAKEAKRAEREARRAARRAEREARRAQRESET